MANVVLQLKTIGIDNILQFDFMDKPPLEAHIFIRFILELLLTI